jgi:hypothetical protein
MLVDAMAMQRALVVLDDPWLPEQVRFLNPVDGSHTEHRLLVTTRIRSLMPRAACIELALMSREEAAALLLGLANIKQAAYLKQHKGAEWPPKAAHDIAAECGLLPMTLSIASQVVRSWGDGWEESVLPLLKQQSNKSSAGGSGAALSTVEARIIGAGLKALKGEDADAIEELFVAFAVTQEDCVHSMPVIELLWRSCCAFDSSRGDDLGMRLKVRQWTQMLVDHSLLLGSFTKGVHVHDIVLTYLRNTHAPSELRALQKRVVEELVRMSTVRAFEDTGSTSKAFAGEEVDWYVCNVGSFHIQQTMDSVVPLVENADALRWILVDDTVLSRQVALAVGEEELEKLVAHSVSQGLWFEGAKIKLAITLLTKRPVAIVFNEALALLEKCGSTRTIAALQLELDIIGNQTYLYGNPKFVSGTPEKARLVARVAELSQNGLLRTDPWKLINGTVFPKVIWLMGVTVSAWQTGQVDLESVFKGMMSLWVTKATPLMQMACDKAVGARKVRGFEF